MSSAEAKAPMRIEICCRRGVPPTRKPVLRSCDTVPPFEQAMHTMPPTESAVTYHAPPVQPTSRNTRQVSMRVAMVMPETGFEEEPISPVSREDTVTNSAPKITTISAPSRFMCSEGASMIIASSTRMPMPTNFIDRSRSRRSVLSLPPRAAETSAMPCLMLPTISGSERTRLMMPAAATAPAPM
jgi:hypothetical protein